MSPLVTTTPYQLSIWAAVACDGQLPEPGQPLLFIHELPSVDSHNDFNAANSTASGSWLLWANIRVVVKEKIMCNKYFMTISFGVPARRQYHIWTQRRASEEKVTCTENQTS